MERQLKSRYTLGLLFTRSRSTCLQQFIVPFPLYHPYTTMVTTNSASAQIFDNKYDRYFATQRTKILWGFQAATQARLSKETPPHCWQLSWHIKMWSDLEKRRIMHTYTQSLAEFPQFPDLEEVQMLLNPSSKRNYSHVAYTTRLS